MSSDKYRIGNAARRAGVAVETLRSYADRGLVSFEWFEDQRVFDESAIEEAQRVRRSRPHRRSVESAGVG